MATKKQPAKRTTKRKPKPKPDMNAKWSILIFGIGALLLAITYIKGDSVWLVLHNTLFNFFGVTAFFVAPIIIYAAVLVAFNKPMWGRIIKAVLLMGFVGGTFLVFSKTTFTDLNFAQAVAMLYSEGSALTSGLFGAILGWPLLVLCGRPAANVIIILLVLIFAMLVTGVTPGDIYSFFAGHASNARDKASRMREERILQAELDEQNEPEDEEPAPKRAFANPFSAKRNAVIDLDLGPSAEQTIDTEEEPPIIGPGGTFGMFTGNTKSSIDVDIDDTQIQAPPEMLATEGKPIKSDSVAESDKEVQAEISSLIKKAVGYAPEIIADKNDQLTIVPAQSEKGSYAYPPLSLFQPQKQPNTENVEEELEHNADLLVKTLASFGVQTRVLDISRGPSVTRYELQPLAGVKISRITNLADDIALNLATAGVRIEAPIPNKAAVGIEVPNRNSTSVSIRSILESSTFAKSASPLTLALGKDIAGNSQIADLTRMPHLLIAGSTGSGKSVCINSIIISMLYKSSPEDVKLIMIDPKVVELAEYNGIPHLLMPVVTEPRKAAGALGSAVAEMEKRYRLFAENNVREIKSYNKLAEQSEELEKMPYIAIIIDELADLMMVAGKEVEDYICRIAQKARAAGMHLIVATQRPSVDVITGLIKANIPSRIAFAVSSQIDSRTILDAGGAEKLLGMGDMLFMPVGSNKPVRIQGTYVKDEEISGILDFIKKHGNAEYSDAMIEEMEKRAVPEKAANGSQDGNEDSQDPMVKSAIEVVIDAGQASTSLLQRRLKLGYARAARIVDEMEAMHIVGPYEGSKPRQVLINRQQWIEMSMQQSDDATP